MSEKVLAPTVAWQTEDVWNALSDKQRAEMVETVTQLATERLEQLAQARQGGAFPWRWYLQDWEGRGGNALAGFSIAVKESNCA